MVGNEEVEDGEGERAMKNGDGNEAVFVAVERGRDTLWCVPHEANLSEYTTNLSERPNPAGST